MELWGNKGTKILIQFPKLLNFRIVLQQVHTAAIPSAVGWRGQLWRLVNVFMSWVMIFHTIYLGVTVLLQYIRNMGPLGYNCDFGDCVTT
jgi:hypothetical protein